MDSRSAPVTREGESRVDQISITAELIQTYAGPLFYFNKPLIMFPPSPPPFSPSHVYLIRNEGVFFDTFSVNVSHMKGGAAGVQAGMTERKKHIPIDRSTLQRPHRCFSIIIYFLFFLCSTWGTQCQRQVYRQRYCGHLLRWIYHQRRHCGIARRLVELRVDWWLSLTMGWGCVVWNRTRMASSGVLTLLLHYTSARPLVVYQQSDCLLCSPTTIAHLYVWRQVGPTSHSISFDSGSFFRFRSICPWSRQVSQRHHPWHHGQKHRLHDTP